VELVTITAPLPAVDEIAAICSLIGETYCVPVYHLDELGDIRQGWSTLAETNPFHEHEHDLRTIIQLGHFPESAQLPFLHPTKFLEYFMIVPLRNGDRSAGAIAIGPFVFSVPVEDRIAGLMKDYNFSYKRKAELLRYYTSVPVMERRGMYQASLLCYFMIYRVKLDLKEVMQRNVQPAYGEVSVQRDLTADLASRRQNAFYHHTPEWDRKLIQFVREGRKEDLAEWVHTFPTEQMGILSKKSHLRSQKNLAICGITVVTRAAMDGGLYSEMAYTLSDRFIQRIEDCRELEEVTAALFNAYFDFTERVRLTREQRYSRTVNLCRTYISDHIYEDITLQQLSGLTGLHPNYLSRLFKKEVGLQPSVYMQRERIEEAKKLLAFTDQTLTDIWSRLNFNDQSYFTKSFKKFTGLTPRQFRQSSSPVQPDLQQRE
jgi:AraC-like DNA-binding protein